MNDLVRELAGWSTAIIEIFGIGVITFIALYSVVAATTRLLRRHDKEDIFQELRQRLGRGILLGLEFLIAADIIHTVAIEMTLKSVGVLAAIVLVRTFLSFTLDVELTGRWPWQHNNK